MVDLNIRVRNGFDPLLQSSYSYSFVMGANSLSLASPSNVFIAVILISNFSFKNFLICNKYMIVDSDEKRLVQNYKATNKQLRKQLENLNNEVDKIIAFKTNRIGLKKLPAVDKSLQKTQDVKLLQLQVDNLRKRLEQLTHDNQNLKARNTINHMAMAKQLEDQLALKKTEKETFQKQIYAIDKVSMTLNTTDLPEEQMKLYDRIQAVNQQLIRVKKIESELLKDIDTKQKVQNKKNEFIKNSIQTYNKFAQQAMNSRVDIPVTHKGGHNEQEWRNLKKEFLQLKESKMWEQNALNQENDRLRAEIRQLQLKCKQKKNTIDNIKSLEIRRKQRNYSTIDQQASKPDENFRYRGRNNSYKYATKN